MILGYRRWGCILLELWEDKHWGFMEMDGMGWFD